MKTNIILSILTATFLVGCGSSSSTSNTLATNTSESDTTTQTIASNPVDITVERGPVIGAYVTDNSGKRAYSLGEGKYRFNQTPSYPITVYGGYIDVNRDGNIDEQDTKLNVNLSLHEQNQTNVTLVTTLAQNEAMKNEIMNMYGLTEEELYSMTPSQSLEVASISDEVYRYCLEKNTSLDSVDAATLEGLRSKIQAKLQYSQSLQGDIVDIVKQNEIDLMGELDIELNSDEITKAQSDINHSATIEQDPSALVEAMPTVELTQEQIDGLVFMYQEEKVARDVYLKLYEAWGIKVFENIAKSEQSHMDAVKALLEKYEIEVPVADDSYGEFALEELQALYDALMSQALLSSTDALEVGKLIEETDIVDLKERIVDAPEDIKTIYNSLLEGSYNHLDAFTSQFEGSLGGGVQGNPQKGK
jgi:outer membrane lipoprotein SlyB